MILLLSTAFAWESPPVDVVLQDEVILFEGVTFSTGWVPANSPIQANFEFLAEGGTWVEMEGESFLYWPESVTHGYEAIPETGVFLMDQTLDVDAALRVDVAGIGFEIPIVGASQRFEGEDFFEPWLLDDGTGEQRWAVAQAEGSQSNLVDQTFNIYTGIGVQVKVDWRTDALAEFTGVQFDSSGSIITQEFEEELFAPPEDGLLVLDSVFTGRYHTVLDLVMIPSFGVCIDFLGCITVAQFDIPVPLVDDEFDQEFELQVIEHGVPVLEVDTLTCDFGEVLVGQIAHCELGLSNLGAFDVEGSAGILGAAEFAIFPEDLLARPETTDGITVTFAPTFEGEQAATLILNTSDPNYPALEIPLVGTGYLEPEEVTVITSETGCNCSTNDSEAPLPAMALVLLGAVVARRRA